jgi:peptide/nickel transport system substrate-binding protein
MTESRHVVSRRAFLRYSGAVGAAAAVTSALQACGSGPASTTSEGAGGNKDLITAVIGYGNDQSWDPTQTASAFAMAGINHIYEALVETDAITREPRPGLATAVPTDTAGTSWKLTLREGAKWHDGQPVTADDVVFTFQRVLDPTTNVLVGNFFRAWLGEVKKTGDRDVELVLKFPFPDGVQRLSIAKIMPKHVFGVAGAWDQAKAGKTCGSGPYRQTSHQPKSNTTFEAFADYNGPRKATVKKMNWLTIVDAAARVAKISGGSAEAQIADNVPYANIDQLRSSGLKVEGGKGMNHMFLMFNTAKFPDPRVRQALFHAIDTKKMIDVALKGHGTPATSFLNEDNPSYRKASTVYGYDPDKAKSLLAAAGVSGLTVTLMAVNVSWIADCLPTIANSWDAIGVKTTLQPQDTSALFTKMDQSQDYQVVAAASNPNQFGIDADLILRYNYTKGGLWMKYTKWDASPDAAAVFALMDQAVREPDKQKKLALTHQYLDLIAQHAVLYPVLHTELMTAWDPKRLSGIRAQGYPGIDLSQAKRS